MGNGCSKISVSVEMAAASASVRERLRTDHQMLYSLVDSPAALWAMTGEPTVLRAVIANPCLRGDWLCHDTGSQTLLTKLLADGSAAGVFSAEQTAAITDLLNAPSFRASILTSNGASWTHSIPTALVGPATLGRWISSTGGRMTPVGDWVNILVNYRGRFAQLGVDVADWRELFAGCNSLVLLIEIAQLLGGGVATEAIDSHPRRHNLLLAMLMISPPSADLVDHESLVKVIDRLDNSPGAIYLLLRLKPTSWAIERLGSVVDQLPYTYEDEVPRSEGVPATLTAIDFIRLVDRSPEMLREMALAIGRVIDPAVGFEYLRTLPHYYGGEEKAKILIGDRSVVALGMTDVYEKMSVSHLIELFLTPLFQPMFHSNSELMAIFEVRCPGIFDGLDYEYDRNFLIDRIQHGLPTSTQLKQLCGGELPVIKGSECPICYDAEVALFYRPCGHGACPKCIVEYADKKEEDSRCGVCGVDVEKYAIVYVNYADD